MVRYPFRAPVNNSMLQVADKIPEMLPWVGVTNGQAQLLHSNKSSGSKGPQICIVDVLQTRFISSQTAMRKMPRSGSFAACTRYSCSVEKVSTFPLTLRRKALLYLQVSPKMCFFLPGASCILARCTICVLPASLPKSIRGQEVRGFQHFASKLVCTLRTCKS